MKIRIALPVIAAIASAPAAAYDYTERAPVISAIPVYESVGEPRRECWTESVARYETPARSNAGSIVGAVAGGLLGAQVGKGNGRIAAAAAGAAIGALVGDRMDSGYVDAYPVDRQVRRCHTTSSYREELTGYEVTYRYRGRDAMVVLPYDPGASVLIGVEVADDYRRPAVYVLPPTHGYRPIEITHVVYIDDPDFYDRRDRKGKKHKHRGKHKGSPHWY